MANLLRFMIERSCRKNKSDISKMSSSAVVIFHALASQSSRLMETEKHRRSQFVTSHQIKKNTASVPGH